MHVLGYLALISATYTRHHVVQTEAYNLPAHTLAEEGLPQRGREAGLSAVATQPQPPEPQKPLLPGPAPPHMGIVMLQQPGSQATHQHF